MLRLLRTGTVARVAPVLRSSRSAARQESRAGIHKHSKKAPLRLLALALAGAIALAPSVATAGAYCPPKVVAAGGSSSTGPLVVGCIGASALGLIVAALMKKNGELTTQQAQTIAFSCGLGFFLVANELKKK